MLRRIVFISARTAGRSSPGGTVWLMSSLWSLPEMDDASPCSRKETRRSRGQGKFTAPGPVVRGRRLLHDADVERLGLERTGQPEEQEEVVFGAADGVDAAEVNDVVGRPAQVGQQPRCLGLCVVVVAGQE